MDRYVGALVDLFGIEAKVSVDFFYVDEVSTPCESLGCVRNHAVFSLEPVQEHELVHAVRSFAGLSNFFIEEGAAELWGDDSRKYPFRSNTAGDLDTAIRSVTLFEEGLPPEAYGIAGRFHALLAQDAPEAPNSLLVRTSRMTTADQLASHLEAVTGRDIAQWGALLDSYPVCDQGEFRDPVAACDSVRTVERCDGSEVVDIEEWVGCDDEETLGPRDGEIWKYVAVEFVQPGTYAFFIEHDIDMKGGSVRIEECRGGCGSIVEEYPVPQSVTPGRAFDAMPGKYLLRLSLPEFESGMFNIRIGGNCG